MRQGVLPFQYVEERSSTGMTAMAGLGVYLDLFEAVGLKMTERPDSTKRWLTLGLLLFVTEARQVAEHRRRQRDIPTTLGAPPPPKRPSLSTLHPVTLGHTQHSTQPSILLQYPKAWRRDELAVRRDVLRRLVGNAYRLTQRWQGQEGEPFIVYTDFPRVTSALENMHNELDRDGRLSPNLVTVVMAMADAAKVPVKSLNERFITRPFVPGEPGGRLEA